MNQRRQGFTAVELLVSIIVGVVFFITVGQLYSVVINDAADSRNRANASSLAYTQARTVYKQQANTSCSASSASITLTSTGLPGTVTRTTVVDCPFNIAGNYPTTVSRITVTITYGNPQETVRHVLYQY
jgi:type II secretory pathway pseudopilin PulG